MLKLHYPIRAEAQFRTHMMTYKRPVLPLPPAAAAAHGAWQSRQFAVMAELLSQARWEEEESTQRRARQGPLRVSGDADSESKQSVSLVSLERAV